MASARRLRSYLTPDEVARLLRAAKKGRHGVRNHAMVLLAYRHGLRASEVVGLRWSAVDLARGTIYCRRAKGSNAGVHPLARDEVAALRRLQPIGDDDERGEFVFRSERGGRMSRSAFWRVVAQAGERAQLPMRVYAHLLRHACGYALANKGCDLRLIQDYLGHRQIQNTVRYTALNPARFAGLW